MSWDGRGQAGRPPAPHMAPRPALPSRCHAHLPQLLPRCHPIWKRPSPTPPHPCSLLLLLWKGIRDAQRTRWSSRKCKSYTGNPEQVSHPSPHGDGQMPVGCVSRSGLQADTLRAGCALADAVSSVCHSPSPRTATSSQRRAGRREAGGRGRVLGTRSPPSPPRVNL